MLINISMLRSYINAATTIFVFFFFTLSTYRRYVAILQSGACVIMYAQLPYITWILPNYRIIFLYTEKSLYPSTRQIFVDWQSQLTIYNREPNRRASFDDYSITSASNLPLTPSRGISRNSCSALLRITIFKCRVNQQNISNNIPQESYDRRQHRRVNETPRIKQTTFSCTR